MPATKKKPRTRRTPEAAREMILAVASRRLAELGLGGLKIADVAAEAGISHATLLHHFGSAQAMQQALIADMEAALLHDILQALGQPDPDAGAVCSRLFDALATGGTARLLAWGAATGEEREIAAERAHLFDAVVRSLAARRGAPDDLKTARFIVLMVATSAIGFAITGGLGGAIGLSKRDAGNYPKWLASVVEGFKLPPD